MKLIYTLILSFPLFVFSQAGEWAWMKGNPQWWSDDQGDYGFKGVAAATNNPPCRYACGYWTYTTGYFWVYGGVFVDGTGPEFTLNDMWEFDPLTNNWTWINGSSHRFEDVQVIAAPKGVYDSANAPGSLGFGIFTWVTTDNHFWIYGGSDSAASRCNLWQFNPAANMWAWMGNFGPNPHYGVKGIGDSTTMPGARSENNTAWVDSTGNLWLFGGYTGDGGNAVSYNDLWR